MQRVDVKLKWDLTSPNRPCDEKCPATLVTLVRPTLRMPPSRGDPGQCGWSASVMLQICHTYRPERPDLRLPRHGPRLAHIGGQNTTPAHEPRNPPVQSARTNTAGRLPEGFRDV